MLNFVVIKIPRRAIAVVSFTLSILCFIFYFCSTATFKNIEYDINNMVTLLTNSSYEDCDDRQGKLAIVIDDFGENRNGVKEMMSIKRRLTFAVMPFLTHSKDDSEEAYSKGFEVIVHMPMEPKIGNRNWLGPKPILARMSKDEVEKLTQDAFDDILHAKGANNHMGSKATSSERVMAGLLEILKDKNMYFLDSLTTAKSKSIEIGHKLGVKVYLRDIFLDGINYKEYMKKQLRKAAIISLKKGSAVAIGHVGEEGGRPMAEAIIEMLDEFDKHNVKLVYVSEL